MKRTLFRKNILFSNWDIWINLLDTQNIKRVHVQKRKGTKMHILLCDDDETVIVELLHYLKTFFKKYQLPQPTYATYNTGEELLLREVRGGDIVFLDVEMTGISGIHVGVELKKRNPNVKIFIVTSYVEYLDEAMRFHVFRYLSKPIDKERLFRNMKDALCQHSEDERVVLIESKDGTAILRENEIVFVETFGRGTCIHTSNAVYQTTKCIEYWQGILSSQSFYMSHRSFVVNMKYVLFFNNNTIELGDQTGMHHSVFMSRRKYRGFRNAYLTYTIARM